MALSREIFEFVKRSPDSVVMPRVSKKSLSLVIPRPFANLKMARKQFIVLGTGSHHTSEVQKRLFGDKLPRRLKRRMR